MLAFVTIAALHVVPEDFRVIVLIMVYVAGAASLVGGQSAPDGIGPRIDNLLMDAACEFFAGLEYTRDPGEDFPVSRFSRLALIPKHDECHLSDLLEGRYRDRNFRMVEATLEAPSVRLESVR